MTDTVRVPREPLEPVVYGDERDELLALIRKRCPDFTAFPECPPEDMVKGGDTERKNDEAIERAFQDFRLAASPQGEGSSADALPGDLREKAAAIIDANKYEAWTVDRANQMADAILSLIQSERGGA